jgi:hypothetical protein
MNIEFPFLAAIALALALGYYWGSYRAYKVASRELCQGLNRIVNELGIHSINLQTLLRWTGPPKGGRGPSKTG